MRSSFAKTCLAFVALFSGGALAACGLAKHASADAPEVDVMLLHSPAFGALREIPSKYTCEGTNVSPPLAWSNVPEHAKTLVLIVDDPDAPDPAAPRMTWVHWVLFNIPATTTIA